MIIHTCLQLQQQQQQLLQSCNEHWQARAGILHFALVYGATASVAAQRGAVHHLTAHLVCSYASNSPVTNMFFMLQSCSWGFVLIQSLSKHVLCTGNMLYA